MSLHIMAKKVRNKQMVTKGNAVNGFSLGYTNTGKNLMGRTVSRYNGIANSLQTSVKYRRLHCCEENTKNTTRTYCVPAKASIKAPIMQTSQHARLKRLTTTKCGCNVWQQMPDRSSKEYLIIKAGDHIAMDASKNSMEKSSTNTNCVTSNTAADTRTASSTSSGRYCFTKPYRKSLNSNISRLKTCNVTKDVKKSESAGEKIQRIKAELLTCKKANPKPNVKSKCSGT
tara:strand:+ start:2487 stop:3173 length:687 start_codon:yes stop_codon:yes gene_type:complete